MKSGQVAPRMFGEAQISLTVVKRSGFSGKGNHNERRGRDSGLWLAQKNNLSGVDHTHMRADGGVQYSNVKTKRKRAVTGSSGCKYAEEGNSRGEFPSELDHKATTWRCRYATLGQAWREPRGADVGAHFHRY